MYETAYSYTYDTNGRIFSVTDHMNNETTLYQYDARGRLTGSVVYDEETYLNLYGTQIFYDEESRVSLIVHSLDYTYSGGVANENFDTMYLYNSSTGLVESMQISYGGTALEGIINPTYDGLCRTDYKTINFCINGTNVFYNYLDYTYLSTDDGLHSGLVWEMVSEVRTNSASAVLSSTTYRYQYDANGNITRITDENNVVQHQYEYDALGQLTREDNRPLNCSYKYYYDNAGNITKRETYAFTIGTLGSVVSTKTYTYGQNGWGDLLTSANGESIVYDSIGNPTDIFATPDDGTGFVEGYHLTWNGRQLTSYNLGEGYSGEIDTYLETVEYTYNADGIRTSKTVNGVKHEYVLNGSQVLAESWTSNSKTNLLLYVYDDQGMPIGMRYHTSTYGEGVFLNFFFEKNLQGDIVALYDESGRKLCTYTYDAWGNVTCTMASDATAAEERLATEYNPFRYRGYFYDVETGLYYLQSRYYNPSWCRFINADRYVSTDTGLIGHNVFTYCNNNPVMYVDQEGEFLTLFLYYSGVVLVGLVVGLTVSDVVDIVEGEVSATKVKDKEENDNVQVQNSCEIVTPWVQYGYSVYLNHFNPETKDVIKGTSTGMQYEWFIHNCAYALYSITGDEVMADRAKSVDMGRTIFSDPQDKHGIGSIFMKVTYRAYGLIPWLIDLALQ